MGKKIVKFSATRDVRSEGGGDGREGGKWIKMAPSIWSYLKKKKKCTAMSI